MSTQPKPSPDDALTCWTLIHDAAGGCHQSLDQFLRRYEQVVRRTLAIRWKSSWRQAQIDDAVQEVFWECIRPSGVLTKADHQRAGGFRALLYGVTRNVMRRFEAERAPANVHLPDVITDESTVSRVFDRELAQSIMKEASLAQRRLADEQGGDALRRVELLKARFVENQPIREIAERWQVDPAWLHRQYAKAREEFLQALLQVVASYQPNATHAENVRTCKELLSMLG